MLRSLDYFFMSLKFSILMSLSITSVLKIEENRKQRNCFYCREKKQNKILKIPSGQEDSANKDEQKMMIYYNYSEALMDITQSSIKLVIARHGETQHNKSHTICGQQPGKLTPVGIQQAAMIGKHFNKTQKHFHYIYVSDLGRTRQTFENAAKNAPHLNNVPIKFMQAIRERCGGILQNQPLDSWAKNAQKQGKSVRAYKCQGAESWEDVMKRTGKLIEFLVTEHIINKKEKQIDVLVVSHGGFIMEMHNTCNRFQGKQIVFNNSARNCSMHTFQISYPLEHPTYQEENVQMKCIEANFVGHLQK